MKMLTLAIMSLCVIGALLTGLAEAQVSCMQMGKFLTCVGPNGQNSTQMDMGRGRGVISGQSQYGAPSYMEPYMVLPAPTQPSPFTVPSPQSPRAPSFPGAIDPLAPLEMIQPIQPIFAPMSLGGDAGQ